MNKKCENCKYGIEYSEAHSYIGLLDCRRHAPVYIPKKMTSEWPIVKKQIGVGS